MQETTETPARPGPGIPESFTPCPGREWAWLGLMALVLILAVNRQSLWIDEANTAASSSQGSLAGWWRKLTEIGGSDLQMPLYMFYMWGWVKVAGNGEWALRAAGLVWLVPGLVAMASGFSRPIQRAAVMLVAVSNAFVWYYAGEARPYAMQLGASCLIFAALHRLGREEISQRQQSLWLSGFLSGLVMLCGSSLLGVIWSIGAVAAVFILIPRRRLLDLWKSGWLRLAVTGLLLVVLGLYYLWTLTAGARASGVAQTDWKTVVFVFYEQLGLAGLGPGRLELRQAGLQTLRPYLLPLAAHFLLLTIVAISGARQALRLWPGNRVRALALAAALPGVMLLGVGFAAHFRVLGRHFTPLMPVWFSLLALGLAALWGRGGWMGKAAAASYMILSVCSCLSIRLAARHERDDYRDAAQYARLALRQNQVVWWNGSMEGAWYYQVPLDMEGKEKNSAVPIINPPAESIARLKKPDVIVVSKPDIFDSGGTLADYLARNHYRATAKFPAFTIWQD